MALKPLECPVCHGLIETFDETTKKGFCPFCDALISDVPSFQDAYEVRISGPVKVEGVEGADEVLKRIDGFILIGNKERASQLLDEFVDKYPADFRGWDKLFHFAVDGKPLDGLNTNAINEHAKNMSLLAKTQEERVRLDVAGESLKKQLDAVAEEKQTMQEKLKYYEGKTAGLKGVREQSKSQYESSAKEVEQLSAELDKADRICKDLKEERIKFDQGDHESTYAQIGCGTGCVSGCLFPILGSTLFPWLFALGYGNVELIYILTVAMFMAFGAIAGWIIADHKREKIVKKIADVKSERDRISNALNEPSTSERTYKEAFDSAAKACIDNRSVIKQIEARLKRLSQLEGILNGILRVLKHG